MKSKCNTLTTKTKKRYFEYIAENKNFSTGKTFWNTLRPFITNKGTISDEKIEIKTDENQNIKIKNKIENKLVSIKTKVCIKDESVLVEMFNNHYIDIVKKKHLVLYQNVLEISLCKKMMKKLLKFF